MPKNQKPALSPSVDAVSGHLVTCQRLTVRHCREVSRAPHLSSGLSSQSSLLTSPARCCEPLCNYSDLLRLTGFTLKTVTTHNTFCVKMDTAVAISELNTSRGSHSFFPCFFFFFWTGHCLFWLLVPYNISLLFYDAEETRVWERTDRTWKECIAVCVHNKHKHLGKCDDWRLKPD